MAGVVLKWVSGERETNFLRAERLIRQAAAAGANIVCTTESFLDGYAVDNENLSLEEYRELGEPVPDGKYVQRLANLASELRIYLVAGLTEADGEQRRLQQEEELGRKADRSQGDGGPLIATQAAHHGAVDEPRRRYQRLRQHHGPRQPQNLARGRDRNGWAEPVGADGGAGLDIAAEIVIDTLPNFREGSDTVNSTIRSQEWRFCCFNISQISAEVGNAEKLLRKIEKDRR